MRRSIWSAVLFTVVALMASASLPHTDLRQWSLRLNGVRGAIRLSPPSWPAPVLREHRWMWAGPQWSALMPSWPLPALRGRVTASRPSEELPVAGPVAMAREAERWNRYGYPLLATLLLVLALLGVVELSNVLAPPSRSRARTVGALARRGLAHDRIARGAGLPRDAIRSLLAQAIPVRAPRRRA